MKVMAKRWSHMLNGYDILVNGSASTPSFKLTHLRLGQIEQVNVFLFLYLFIF